MATQNGNARWKDYLILALIGIGAGGGTNAIGRSFGTPTRSDADIKELAREVVASDAPWIHDKPFIEAKLDEILAEIRELRAKQ